MIIPGLVSVTFKTLPPSEIINLVQQADVRAIEWGGDRHVPHGDVKTAQEVRAMTEEAGLLVAAYGSYYRVGCEGGKSPEFGPVLDTAVALGAPTIRVWAGDHSSYEARDSYWRKIERETRRVADLAQEAGITISFEFHGNTLNDNVDGARRLFRSVDHDNIRSYWQPDPKVNVGERLNSLKLLRRRLSNIHVFHWFEGARRPLADGEEEWRRYLRIASDTGRDHYALMEFVQEDMPTYFIRDAMVLHGIITQVHHEIKKRR